VPGELAMLKITNGTPLCKQQRWILSGQLAGLWVAELRKDLRLPQLILEQGLFVLLGIIVLWKSVRSRTRQRADLRQKRFFEAFVRVAKAVTPGSIASSPRLSSLI
jgi:hypothetical protein